MDTSEKYADRIDAAGRAAEWAHQAQCDGDPAAMAREERAAMDACDRAGYTPIRRADGVIDWPTAVTDLLDLGERVSHRGV